MYIHATHSISRAQSLGDKVGGNNAALKGEKLAAYPDYTTYIPASIRRRMSVGVRMGVTCAKALGELGSAHSVIVGTGMGCIIESVNFMNDIKAASAVSPTSFIQSVHNTVAGQIAINMQNTGYNMTFSHGGFSFESALKDAQILCQEGQAVLVGGVEEYSETYAEFEGMNNEDLSEGASFFNVSSREAGAIAKVSLIDHLSCTPGGEETALLNYTQAKGIVAPQHISKGQSVPGASMGDGYSDICGIYMSNAAFGLYLACQQIKDHNSIAIVNRFNDHNCGLTIVAKP